MDGGGCDMTAANGFVNGAALPILYYPNTCRARVCDAPGTELATVLSLGPSLAEPGTSSSRPAPPRFPHHCRARPAMGSLVTAPGR